MSWVRWLMHSTAFHTASHWFLFHSLYLSYASYPCKVSNKDADLIQSSLAHSSRWVTSNSNPIKIPTCSTQFLSFLYFGIVAFAHRGSCLPNICLISLSLFLMMIYFDRGALSTRFSFCTLFILWALTFFLNCRFNFFRLLFTAIFDIFVFYLFNLSNQILTEG